VQGIVFFVLYFQTPTSLTFFAIHNVEHNIWGIPVAPEQFQALNSVWIIAASPILAILYHKLGDRFSMPYKFATGMALTSLSFLVLKISAIFPNTSGIVSSNWLIVSYGFQSVGELLISGLGIAMIAQLVPRRITGFGMGMWHLSSSVSAVIAGWVATFTAAPKGITDPQQTLMIYADVFANIGYVTTGIAVITLFFAPKLTRIINGETSVSKEKLTMIFQE
jgi:POT family proton-dependent oligopeptide transporter